MVELEEVERAMKRHADPVVTTTDLADELDCTSRHIHDQLQLLRRADAVASKKVGARARAWWHTERVTPPALPPEDDPDQSALRDHERRENRAPRETERPADDLADDLEALDLPGDGDRVEAVRAAFELLRERGESEKSDFIAELYDDGHDAGYSSPGGWWNTIGKKGLRGLADRRDDVRAPPEGGRKWRYVPSDD